MTDREKVLKALKCCAGIDKGKTCIYKATANDCPYVELCGEYEYAYYDCTTALAADALELLKEQEAVKPIKKDTVEITARYEFDCQCGAPLLIGQPYCANCGRSVKWE